MTRPMSDPAPSLAGRPAALPRSAGPNCADDVQTPVTLIGAPSLRTAGVAATLAHSRFKLWRQCERFDEVRTVPPDPLAICLCVSPGAHPRFLMELTALRRSNPSLRILAVSDDRDLAVAAGADAQLTMDACPRTLLDTLALLVRANDAMPRSGEKIPLGVTGRAPAPDRLSTREIEVATAIARGLSNKYVARLLAIAEPTVKAHLRTILRKTGAANRTQLAVWLFKHGPVPNPSPGSARPAAWAEAERRHEV